jgi:hypothetical protein
VLPVAPSTEVLDAWEQFQQLKRDLLTPSDYHDYGGKPRVTKSGWTKLATAFGITTDVIRLTRSRVDGLAGPVILYECVVRATAKNGRYMEAVGSCASDERRFTHLEHDLSATAQTRAQNRAVSNLIGGGEVSAEEVEEQRRPPSIEDARKLACAAAAALGDGDPEHADRVDLAELLAWSHICGGNLRLAWRRAFPQRKVSHE